MIHNTACVDAKAQIGEGVSIGPFCSIGPDVILDDKVTLLSHVSISGRVHIGSGTTIYPFACIGYPPQHRAYKGEDSCVYIGCNNIIREHVTIHSGTAIDRNETRIGDGCMIMVGSHIAHDCVLKNHITMANGVMLGGHTVVEDYVTIGGMSGIHQRVRIGEGAIIGGLSGVEGDVIPFGSVWGNRAHLYGINIIGLRRRGIERSSIQNLRRAYRLLFAPEGTLVERMRDVQSIFDGDALVQQVLDFIRIDSSRSLCLPQDRGDK